MSIEGGEWHILTLLVHRDFSWHGSWGIKGWGDAMPNKASSLLCMRKKYIKTLFSLALQGGCRWRIHLHYKGGGQRDWTLLSSWLRTFFFFFAWPNHVITLQHSLVWKGGPLKPLSVALCRGNREKGGMGGDGRKQLLHFCWNLFSTEINKWKKES